MASARQDDLLHVLAKETRSSSAQSEPNQAYLFATTSALHIWQVAVAGVGASRRLVT